MYTVTSPSPHHITVWYPIFYLYNLKGTVLSDTGIGVNFFFFFSLYVFWRTSGPFFTILSSVAPHRGQPTAKCHPRWQPTRRWASAVGWGDAGFEPGTAGQQSGALPLSHHASPTEPPRLPTTEPPRLPPLSHHASPTEPPRLPH